MERGKYHIVVEISLSYYLVNRILLICILKRLSYMYRDVALQGRWPDVLDYLVEQFKLPKKCIS
jgi:hypothetical protein